MRKINALLAIACIALATTGCKNIDLNPISQEEATKPDSQEVEEVSQQTSSIRPEIYTAKEYIYEPALEDGEYADSYLTGYYDNYVLSPETKEAYPSLAETFESTMKARNEEYAEMQDEYLDASKQLRESGEVHD